MIDAEMWAGILWVAAVMAVVTLLALDLRLPGGIVTGAAGRTRGRRGAARARARRTTRIARGLVASLVATGFALFALGLVKGRVAAMALRSGLQVLP